MVQQRIFLHVLRILRQKIMSLEDMDKSTQISDFRLQIADSTSQELIPQSYLGFLRTGLLFVILLVFSVTLGCQRSRAGITVAGSTSVEPFAELLAEEYMSNHPESHIYVQGGGSTAGIEAAITGAANIGMSSRNLINDEKKL